MVADIVQRLNATTLDKDNFPRMGSEKWLPISLALEASVEIERLRVAIINLLDDGDETDRAAALKLVRPNG